MCRPFWQRPELAEYAEAGIERHGIHQRMTCRFLRDKQSQNRGTAGAVPARSTAPHLHNREKTGMRHGQAQMRGSNEFTK